MRSAPYKDVLKSISARTGTPLSSLIVSFGVLHELTAIAPLVGVFYGSRALGVGERIVSAAMTDNSSATQRTDGWMNQKLISWMDEGEKWAERVGKRYGIFGFQKPTTGQITPTMEGVNHGLTAGRVATTRIAGDVANAVVAYAVTKAILPLRIGCSLYLSPAFSRRVVEPFRQFVLRPFRK